MLNCLNYPFDAKLINRKKLLLRQELEKTEGLIEKRVAILGGATTHDFVVLMELFLLKYGIKPIFYESEYAQYWEDAVFGNQALNGFKPDVIFIMTSNRNIKVWPKISDSEKEVDDKFNETIDHFKMMWNALSAKFKCPVIQNNFEFLPYRLLGNLDGTEIHGRINFINRLNSFITNWAHEHDGFFVNDINWQSADFGLERWHDLSYWCLYKYAMSKAAMPFAAFNVSNIIKAVFGKNKKALALDLDNTLWGGIVGDDGVDGLALGPETAVGQCYTEFQEYIKSLSETGVLLNIISKNEEHAAKSGLSHPQMILHESDFISVKANWNPKSKNLIDIAQELSLLPESFVFVDDNPAEREIVRAQVHGAAVPELQAVENYISVLDHGGYFESVGISGDDIKRNSMYRQNVARAQLQASFPDYGAYLDSLRMIAEISPFSPVYMSRIAQLTNKSNQFNLTTRRYTQEEIESISEDKRFITRYGKLVDKFGDNGVVAVAIGEIKDKVCEIVLWLMSCRVLKRDMELAMMDEIVAEATRRGVSIIRGFYYPTAKNSMVKSFYSDLGFAKLSENGRGDTVWELDISPGYQKKNSHIIINPK